MASAPYYPAPDEKVCVNTQKSISCRNIISPAHRAVWQESMHAALLIDDLGNP